MINKLNTLLRVGRAARVRIHIYTHSERLEARANPQIYNTLYLFCIFDAWVCIWSSLFFVKRSRASVLNSRERGGLKQVRRSNDVCVWTRWYVYKYSCKWSSTRTLKLVRASLNSVCVLVPRRVYNINIYIYI